MMRVILAPVAGMDLAPLVALLVEARCDPLVAASAEDAIVLVNKLLPRICIVPAAGIKTPGVEVCRILAMNPDTRNVHVVFIAGGHDIVDPVWARLQGARAVLREPFTRHQVNEMLLISSRHR